MTHWRPLLFISILMCCLSLFFPAASLADSEKETPAGTEETAAEAAEPSEAEKLQTRFETLEQKRTARLEEIAALEIDAQTAVGEDASALREHALELTLDGAGTIRSMWSVIEDLEGLETPPSTQAQRQVLIALLPGVQSSIRQEFKRQTAKREALIAKQAELTDAEALAALEPVIKRKDALLVELLGAGVGASALAEDLGLQTATEKQWLKEQLSRRARLAVSQVSLASTRLEDVGQLESAGSDPAVAQAALAAANLRYQSSLGGLEATVDLLEKLEVDVSDYRRVLIQSTGEVKIDALNREVVTDVFDRLASSVRDKLADDGSQLLFQTLLFLFLAGLFWGLSRLTARVVSRLVEAPHLRFTQLLKRMLVSLSSTTVLVIGLLIALSQLGIEIAPMLAGLGIAGFVLGFALQDTLGNFAAGVMVLIYRPYDVGDMIDCAGGVFGQVSHMSLVSTTILTIDNKTLIVPNSKIWGDVITNVTAQAIRRIDLEFGIGYGDDIPHAEEVLWSVIKDHPKVLSNPEPVVKVHSLGDSSVNFVVRPWVARDDYWDVYWDFMREVKLRFDREGVSIPFPQRDVHFYPTEPPAPPAPATGTEGETDEEMELGSSALAATDEPPDDADDSA